MPESEISEFAAVIQNVTFHNETNGYSVLKFRQIKERLNFVGVGEFANPQPGETFQIKGNWINHPKFGKQFSIQSYSNWQSNDPDTLIDFLSSSHFKGIGKKLAQAIVEKFGTETFEILDSQPEKLKEITQLKTKKREQLLAQWKDHQSLRSILFFLQSHQLSPKLSQKIFTEYGHNAVEQLTTNPYQLSKDVWGIGFLKADSIAVNLGFAQDSFERISAGITYTLDKSIEDGHVYLSREDLETKAAEILKCRPEIIIYTLDNLKDSKEIHKDENDHYSRPWLYFSELGSAKRLVDLAFNPSAFPSNLIDEALAEAYKSFGDGFHYSDTQIKGIHKAANTGVFLLTGGPGTGKTTTLLGLIKVLGFAHLKIKLAAPTGRAAKRMSEVTGQSALTIHRLLKYETEHNGFAHDETNPIEADAVVIDETSMIDTVLFYSLVRAIRPGTRLILVGDPNQLPSVGPGKVLQQLIHSEVIAHLHLNEIFRQAKTSWIVKNAHNIQQGIIPIFPAEGSNFHFRPGHSPDHCIARTVELVHTHLPQHFGYDPWEDIQVLSPMNKGPIGTEILNQKLQEKLNPNPFGLKYKHKEFRLGDKVMQLKNNYDKGVFNGDFGRIDHFLPSKEGLVIRFDEQFISYSLEELDQIGLAYATTIHKSQGSEFKAVIIIMNPAHFIMLQRNLFYTGITRARERVFVVGHQGAIARAVKNNPTQKRNTKLSAYIRHSSGLPPLEIDGN